MAERRRHDRTLHSLFEESQQNRQSKFHGCGMRLEALNDKAKIVLRNHLGNGRLSVNRAAMLTGAGKSQIYNYREVQSHQVVPFAFIAALAEHLEGEFLAELFEPVGVCVRRPEPVEEGALIDLLVSTLATIVAEKRDEKPRRAALRELSVFLDGFLAGKQ